jgi:hypothetical protein
METTECRLVTEQTLGYRNNDLYISAAGIPDFRDYKDVLVSRPTGGEWIVSECD